MSQENVEVLRQGYEAVNGGDIEGFLAVVDPDFEAEVPPELSPEPDTYRGHEGMRRYFRAFEDVMDDIRFVPERFWDVGETVVVAVRLVAKGKESGISAEQFMAQVWTMRDRKATRVRTYPTSAEALEAVGLRE